MTIRLPGRPLAAVAVCGPIEISGDLRWLPSRHYGPIVTCFSPHLYVRTFRAPGQTRWAAAERASELLDLLVHAIFENPRTLIEIGSPPFSFSGGQSHEVT